MTSEREKELRSKLAALVKPARLLKLERVPAAEKLPLAASHFGGTMAYGEPGDKWPVCANCGASESFVLQIDLVKFAVEDLPPIKFLVLFTCWSCLHGWWDADGPRGFHARAYLEASSSKGVAVEPPPKVTKAPTFVVRGSTARVTAPDWEQAGKALTALSSQLTPDEPWGAFEAEREKLKPVGCYKTYVGGHPGWFETDATPRCPTCDARDRLLLQFYSEEVGLLEHMGAGSFFLFACAGHPKDVQLRFQCE
jgi:hypothetical protein